MTPPPPFIYIYIYIYIAGFQRQALAQIGLWVVCRIRPFSVDRPLITELCLRYRLETCSIPLQCGELAPTLEDVTRILGGSEGEPFLGIPLGMSTSYASDCKDVLGILFEKIRGRHDLDIHLGKLRWEFTAVPHRAERMIGGRSPQVLVFVCRRPSHKGKAPVGEWCLVSESIQGESSRSSSRSAARSSGDAKGVKSDIPDLSDGSAIFDEDTMPPQVSLTDEEWREQERGSEMRMRGL
ncbi:hypothetical protein AMTR_s00051p00177750 [Amborella trichopoda]|uniref:Aminotransferase-like plant mobile domain-containing protein n=1 Tax=Amborella trichopoda TaxID=13333 RepID=U5CTR3_AMBTC|nr:hypothetical protein AMTR_s00051p00177750 [Amborella trichopoda]